MAGGGGAELPEEFAGDADVVALPVAIEDEEETSAVGEGIDG